MIQTLTTKGPCIMHGPFVVDLLSADFLTNLDNLFNFRNLRHQVFFNPHFQGHG